MALSKENVSRAATTVLTILTVFWVIELIDLILLNSYLDNFGIKPRETNGLIGILAWPFLHSGLPHLIGNSVGFFILGSFIAVRSMKNFWVVTISVTIIGGVIVWLLGSEGSNHIGASGIVFGFFGFILADAVRNPNWSSYLVAGLTIILFGGMFFGMIPGNPGVSWLGHLGGFIAGIGAVINTEKT